MVASNLPLAFVDTAPLNAGGVTGVVVVEPAMKCTSLYPDNSASILSCRSAARADEPPKINASTRKREKTFMVVASRRVTPGALRGRRLANTAAAERVPAGPGPRGG